MPTPIAIFIDAQHVVCAMLFHIAQRNGSIYRYKSISCQKIKTTLLCLQDYRNQPWSSDTLCVKIGLILINFETENKGKSRVKLNYKAQVRNFHCAIY